MISGKWWHKWPEVTRRDTTDVYAMYGCNIVPLPRHVDLRGNLTVLTPDGLDPVVYAYHSITHPDHARDMDQWHVHKKQTDRFVILSSVAVFALSDGNDIVHIMLGADVPEMLVVPPGVYHCFRPYRGEYVHLLNFPTRVYDSEDEGRVLFVDLDVEHPW